MERFFRELERAEDVVIEATFNRPQVADLATECGLKARRGQGEVRTAPQVLPPGASGRAFRRT